MKQGWGACNYYVIDSLNAQNKNMVTIETRSGDAGGTILRTNFLR